MTRYIPSATLCDKIRFQLPQAYETVVELLMTHSSSWKNRNKSTIYVYSLLSHDFSVKVAYSHFEDFPLNCYKYDTC